MGRQRQVIQNDIARGDHVDRKSGPEEIVEFVGLRLLLGDRENAGNQLHLALDMPRHHCGGLDLCVFDQNMLDLFEFDPASANLDLMVDTPEAFQSEVGSPACQISGPVQARAQPFRKRIAQEFMAGLFRIVEVTATNADAAHIQLAHDTDRRRLQVGIEHIETRVGYGPADRHRCRRGRRCREAMRRNVIGRLGRPIGVDNRYGRKVPEPITTEIGRVGFRLWRSAHEVGPAHRKVGSLGTRLRISRNSDGTICRTVMPSRDISSTSKAGSCTTSSAQTWTRAPTIGAARNCQIEMTKLCGDV